MVNIGSVFVLIVLESPFFVVELRRRIASSQEAGTSTKPVRIYLLVIVRLFLLQFLSSSPSSHTLRPLSDYLPFLIASIAKL